MKYPALFALALLLITAPVQAAQPSGSSVPTLTNFNQRWFKVDPHATSPTNVVKLNIGSSGAPDLPGTIIYYITNTLPIYFGTVTNYYLVGTNGVSVSVSVAGTNVTFLLSVTGANGTTNWFTNTVWNFTGVTNFMSNVVWIINGHTNTSLAGLEDLEWTNSAGWLHPTKTTTLTSVTNLQSYRLLKAMGPFVYNGLSVSNAIVGEFDETTTNKSFLVFQGVSANPSDTWVRLHSPLEWGQKFDVINNSPNGHGFQMLNGDSTWDDPTQFLYLSGGDWISTNRGDMLTLTGTPMGWSEDRRTFANTNILKGDLWRVIAGVLQPSDLTRPTMVTNTIYLSVGKTNSLSVSGSNLTYTNGATSGGGMAINAVNGNGIKASLGVDQDGNSYVGSSAGAWFRVRPQNSAQIFDFTSVDFHPESTNANLGSAGTNAYWKALYAGSTNGWRLLSVTEGATTNLKVNINGKDYNFLAW